MKLVTKPVAFADKADTSRDVIGFSKWAQSSRTISFIMLVLGWFTVPVEVFLRRDFGQRWFTVINFYAGLILLVLIASIQYVWAMIWGAIHGFIEQIASSINPLYSPTERSFADRVSDSSMQLFVVLYILFGSYHLFKIWWRNRTDTAVHSYDDGTSRLEPLAGYLIALLNILCVPFVYLYSRLIPKKQRKGIKIPSLINDRAAFTNTVLEPALLIFLSFKIHGIASMWLLISAIAVAIHANWKETARLNKILDFRDSVFDAQMMMHLKNESEQVVQAATPAKAPALIMKQAAAAIKETPEVASHLSEQYPDLMQIIEDMNKEGSHLAN